MNDAPSVAVGLVVVVVAVVVEYRWEWRHIGGGSCGGGNSVDNFS